MADVTDEKNTPQETPLTWEGVLRLVEKEIAANAPDLEPAPEKQPDAKESRTLSEKIKADPELLEAITQARILLGEAFPASGGVC